MKIFFAKILIFSSVFILTYLFLVQRLTNGYVDMYYQKFTGEARSLVIGLSRADEGIRPDVVEEGLKDGNIAGPIVNFATNQSFYGETYLKAIQGKLRPLDGKNGIYILSVSPASFNTSKGASLKNIEHFDKNTVMGKTSIYTANPNYDYVTSCYGDPLYNAIYNTTKWPHLTSHNDGWNEVRPLVGTAEISDADQSAWKDQNITYYHRKAREEAFNVYRLKWFIKTIEYLSRKGNVFMVRIPADMDIINLENEYSPAFDHKMDSISRATNVSYLNYTKKDLNLKTYDGSHLTSTSATIFSGQLSKDILSSIAKNSDGNK